jgi:tetratricopeptide (TPR) repeat protein
LIHRGTFTFVGGAGNPADSGGPDQSCSSSCEPGHPLIGRDAELDAIHAALSAASSGPSGLRLRGEPGIGKSALLRAAAGVAEAAGITTLAAAGAEFERDLPFTVLADLLAPWAARFLPALPPPQRQALAGAVLLVEDPAAELDHRTVAAATLSAIRAVADAGPVAVVVDDVHWCDDASHVALAYALRRLRAEPVALITGARTNTEPAVDLVDALDQVRVRTIELTGLDEPSMDLLVERQLGMLLSVPTVAALHDASRGNPLLALELAQLMRAGRGTLSNPDGLTAPDRLAATIRGRLRSAGPAVADIVTVVAALGRAPVEALPGLTGHGIAAVDAAVESGLLVRVADRVEVYHPLARNAALAELSDVERRTLHRRLADASTDPYERARHLAAATPGTDETVAAVIEGAARLAQQRGAPAAAANLAERAADLTPTNQLHARVDRWRLAATNHFLTGETARAAHLLRRALDEPGAPHRAAVLRDLARVESERTGAATALPMLAEAIALAGDDQTELAETYQRMAALARQAFGPSVAKEHSVRALRHAERAGDPRLLAACLATQSLIDANLGLPIDDALERGIALERKHGPFSDFDSPRLAKVFQLFWTVDLDQARTEAEALLADLDPYAPAMRINPLYFLGLTEWRPGLYASPIGRSSPRGCSVLPRCRWATPRKRRYG